MAVTPEMVVEFLGTDMEDAELESLLTVADQSVRKYLRPDGVRRCPSETFDLAVLMTTRTLWQQWQSDTGAYHYNEEGSSYPVRNDALGGPVKALISKYRGLGAVG